MENNREKEIVEIGTEIEKLPQIEQKAILWAIENLEMAKEICKNSNMTESEIKKYADEARKKGDHVLLALCGVAKAYKELEELKE